MKQFLHQAFSPSTAAGRRRRRRPAVLVGTVVLMWWAYLVLGSNLAWLLAALGISVVAVWVLRQHPEIAVCIAIATITAATPAVTCVILIDRQVSGAADVAAVLTGYILVAPVPALVACTLCPVLGMVPVNALLGSVVLLLGAATGIVLGDNGAGAAVLLVALSTSVALIVLRHRRATALLLSELPVVNGWTDLGRRTLPDGSRIERLLIGSGQVITCSTTASTVSETESIAAVRTAAAAARALGLSDSRVQPVIMIEQQTPGVQRHLVNDGEVAASVIVTARRHVEDVTRLAPRRRRGHQRCAVLTAALLPVPTGGTSTG
jgi:hypothetical protein